MPKINKKLKNVAKRKAKTKSIIESPKTEKIKPSTSPASAISRRVYEAFGILTLAAAFLTGPSLFSIQFGKGDLMGPFGHALGMVLNLIFGLTGYLVVIAFIIVSIRIFAVGLELDREPGAPYTLWRERFGIVFALLFSSSILHLAARPYRIAGSSAGGIIGEVSGEVLCSLASTAGAWILGLAGLALSLLLATNISWARAGHTIYLFCRWAVLELRTRGRQNVLRFREGVLNFAQLLRHQELSPETDGTATLPSIVRLDQFEAAPELVGSDRPAAPLETAEAGDDKSVLEIGLPQDLEIGAEKSLPPEICISEKVGAEKEFPASTKAGASSQLTPEEMADEATFDAEAEARLAQEETHDSLPQKRTAKNQSKIDALTIVESEFKASEQGIAQEEAELEGNRVEQTDSPGFILNEATYRRPPLSLLEYKENDGPTIDRDAIYRQADLLVKTLADYKIQGRVTEVHPGPVVTMYEFVPAPGTRISKISSLTNDLAMSLAAQRVRIVAPIPGKSAVGIEVPNEQRETVFFKEIMASSAYKNNKAKLPLALGKSIVGAPVAMDLSKMPHLLVAGATGAGKSVSINAMICSLLMNNTPEEVRMIMVDPKFLELSGYNGIPHLMLPVVTDPKQANIALRWTVNEMERRYQLLADMRVRDINAYNRKVDKLRRKEETDDPEPEPDADVTDGSIKEAAPAKILVVRKNADGSEEPITTGQFAPDRREDEEQVAAPATERVSDKDLMRPAKGPLPKRLPFIVVIIDEFADLMMVASKEVETSVARLAQKARAAGIHVILATQRPSVDVITGLIKANFPSRISFQVASTHDSKTILGSYGAENLLGSGDMLVLDRGTEMKRIHGAYISDLEIQRVVDWLRGQGRPVYDLDILKPQEEDAEGSGQEQEAVDTMYDQAVALVAETRQASISMVQRRLRVGYNRAARMVERMEKDGIVSPPDGVKGREVLIQHFE